MSAIIRIFLWKRQGLLVIFIRTSDWFLESNYLLGLYDHWTKGFFWSTAFSSISMLGFSVTVISVSFNHGNCCLCSIPTCGCSTQSRVSCIRRTLVAFRNITSFVSLLCRWASKLRTYYNKLFILLDKLSKLQTVLF